jgi:tetratricopeptide (TPR) repeat protein
MIGKLVPIVLLGLALASGCSRPPTTPAPATSVGASREQGDLLASRGDHAGAVAKYREALQATPNDVGLRFALGSALSQLDRRAEAAEQFRWVVEHGAPGQEEVAMARHWLASASEQESGAGSSSSRRDVTMSSAPGAEGQPASPGVGSVKGKTAWPSVNPDTQPVSLELRFNGDDEATTGKNYRLHIGLGRPYTMSDLPAGAYRVVGRSGGVKLWETRVVVGVGTETALDLTESNSVVTPKDFPPSNAKQ